MKVGSPYRKAILFKVGFPFFSAGGPWTIHESANLPFTEPLDGPQTQAFVRELDRVNAPIIDRGFGGVHFGDSPIVQGLRTIPLLQAIGIGVLLAFGLYALLERGRADREKVWAGMAREAAHQLGTPLSAMAGWIELLRDEADSPTVKRAVQAMELQKRLTWRSLKSVAPWAISSRCRSWRRCAK